MKKTRIFSLLTMLPFVTCYFATAIEADIPGAKEPLGLKRYEGTRVTFYEEKNFAAYTLPLGGITKHNIKETQFAKSLPLEGKVTRVSYIGEDPTRTSLEVTRNYRTELTNQGWKILWEGSEDELGLGKGIIFCGLYNNRPGGTFSLSKEGAHYLAAEKSGVHLALYITNYKTGTVNPKSLQPKPGVIAVALDVIEPAAMEEKMVVVKAAEMTSRILEQGSINLYGFHFDTGSASLQADSSETLDEVEKLLTADKSLRLLVVGHTDPVGNFNDNIELSKKRAASVIEALTKRIPAAADRLTPCGVGYQCPIASNANEEGRAKNRRVALVRVEQ